MKLLDILGKVGGAVVKTMVPGGGLIVDVVNGFLPDDKKLAADATGADMQAAVDSLPPEQRAQLMGREFDVEEARIGANVALMSGPPAQVTRAWIAKWAFILVAVATAAVVLVWGKAVAWDKDDKMVEAVMDGWPFVAALLSPFVLWLNRYFGILRNEQRDRLNAANGSTSGTLSSIINTITNRK